MTVTHVLSNGRTVEIPPEVVAQTKFTRAGIPDRRKDNAAFERWLSTLEKAQESQAAPTDLERAQAYALKVWGGQSVDLGRGERVKRVKAALEGQGLPFDGVKLPGDTDDDDAEGASEGGGDYAPVVWRSQRSR